MMRIFAFSVFFLAFFGCDRITPTKIDLAIPDQIPSQFLLDFTELASIPNWDSLLVVKPYADPNFNELKGYYNLSSLTQSDSHILVLYIDHQRIVAYSLFPRILDLNQLWENSESSDKDSYRFPKVDAKFFFEKEGSVYVLKNENT
ncbi:hypothetical protein SAMN04488104_1008101 [Algoriphagus faecimaris]|uniref:Lipoprotein n=1 Tax=Algoriphagus faecimaris TaxID=686796 RepID=A0A1G6Q8H3_9BACT|nr:hypothetical protein [Algoriphagus faecimaris]SDC88628.1 hypothetical protein SAMN04488104_1008101 [Algoriphagus faecimaris]